MRPSSGEGNRKRGLLIMIAKFKKRGWIAEN